MTVDPEHREPGPATHISVADAKRRFADVLGATRHRGARFVIERRGHPIAAIVPLSDLERLQPEPASGFLGLVGAFDDAPEYADLLDDVVAGRSDQRQRPAPELPG